MANKRDQWADPLADHSGWLTGFLAEEQKIDRRMLWRLASWGVAAVGAVVVAVLASQSQIRLQRDQFAASDMLARQAQQIQQITRESQAESRRLTLAIEGLNVDRDRLATRVASMEQGFEAATGSIKRQAAVTAEPTAATKPAAEPPAASPAPNIATVAKPAAESPPPPPVADATPAAKAVTELPSIPSVPVIGPVATKPPTEAAPPEPAPVVAAEPVSPAMAAWKSMMGPIAPPDVVSQRPAERAAPVASPPPETTASRSPPSAPAASDIAATPVARTEFGVDIGGANSVDGLRAIWRGISKAKTLDGLRPIMVVKERGTGLGMQLRLIAGPLADAAAAAKICASLTESGRPCETTVFEGQRLTPKPEPAPAAAPQPQALNAPATPPAAIVQRPPRPALHKRAAPKPEQRTEPPRPVDEAPAPAPAPKPQSSLTTFLGVN